MDLNSVDDLEFFAHVSESPSLTAAARTWGKSVSAVSKRLARIESRLGVQLVRRSTRRMSLTEEGQRFAAGAKELLQSRWDLEESIAAHSGALKGRIRIQCTRGLGRRHIAGLLGDFVSAHPEVDIDLQLTSLPLDVARTDFDIAIRVGKLDDSRLRVRRLARNRRIVCASPNYLAERPTPSAPADLVGYDCIVLQENQNDFALWRFGAEGNETVSVDGPLRADDGDVVTDWCLQGLGLIMRSTWHVNPLLDSGALIHVLPHIETPAADIFALTPQSDHTPTRVTALLDHLQSGLEARLSGGAAADS